MTAPVLLETQAQVGASPSFVVSGDQLLWTFRALQIVMLGHAIIFTAAFSIQITVEKYQRQDIKPENVKYQLHRLGVISSVVLLVYALDPFTINGFYHELACFELSTVYTSFLVTSVVVLNHASLAVVRASQFQEVPFHAKLFRAVAILTTFGVAIAVPYLAYLHNDMWYTGYYYAWLAVVFFLSLLWFLYNTWTILKYIEASKEKQSEQESGRMRSSSDAQNHARKKQEAKIREMQWRMWFVSFLGCIFVPSEFYAAYKRLTMARGENHFTFVDRERGEPKDFFIILGQLLATWAVLWYSWVKVRFKKPHDPFLNADRGASISSARGSKTGSHSSNISISSHVRNDTESFLDLDEPILPDDDDDV